MGQAPRTRTHAMAACPRLAECSLFCRTLSGMPTLADLYRRLYCQGAWGCCARLRVRELLGEGRVPPSLFPFEKDRALALIRLG